MWQAGRKNDARRLLTMAKDMVEATGETMSFSEIQRLTAEFVPEDRSEAEAEAILQRAIETARDQEARLHELRAAVDLARLWQAKGRDDRIAELADTATRGIEGPDFEAELAILRAG